MNRSGFAYTVLFTFVSAFFFIFILSVVNETTKTKKLADEKHRFYLAILNTVGTSSTPPDQIESRFFQYFPKFDPAHPEVPLTGIVDGREVRVKLFSGKGLWGTIRGVLAISDDTILGLEIVSQNETPGLGGLITSPWFKEQFRNEKIGDTPLTVGRGTGNIDKDKTNGYVDGITGATVTSKAVETIVNEVIKELKKGEVE